MNDDLEDMDVENFRQHDKWWKEKLWSRRDLEKLDYNQLKEIFKPYQEAGLPVPAMDITVSTDIQDDWDRCLKIMEYMVGRPKEFPQQLKDESEEEPYKSMGFGLQKFYSFPFGNKYTEYYRRDLKGFKTPQEIINEKRKADDKRRLDEMLERPGFEGLKKERQRREAELEAAQQDSGVTGMDMALHNPYSVYLRNVF